MTTFAFPNIRPHSISWSLQSNTQAFTSAANGTVQTAERPGARWGATLNYGRLKEADARTMVAFLVGLRGLANRFTMHDHALPVPRGIATGTPLVNGAAQSGGTLITNGWTVSQTGILKAGDMIGFSTELHMVLADVNSDIAGLATILVEPPIRTSPAHAAPIITTSPTATFMLTDKNVRWSVEAAKFYGFSINAIEVFA